MNRHTKIAIIGGGIGGLAVAIALRQKGFFPEVYERIATMRPVGAGIVLAINAMRVLQRLGVDQEILQNGFPIHSVQFKTDLGSAIMAQDLKPFEEKYQAVAVGIHRFALHECLLKQIPRGSVHVGAVCSRVIEKEGGVEIFFEDGRMVEVDIVIVADGLRSRVRSQLFPHETVRYSGESGWRGVTQWTLPREAPFVEYWGRHIRLGAFQSAPDQVCWYTGQNVAAETLPKEGVDSKEMLRKLLKNFVLPVFEILEKTDPATIIRTDLYDKKPTQNWAKGRVVFLGDAVHATTPNFGQGAGMAIESAYVLATQLAESQSYQNAFSAYENIRYPRTSWVTTESLRFGKLAQLENPLLILFRNWAIKQARRPPFSKFQEKNAHRLWGG